MEALRKEPESQLGKGSRTFPAVSISVCLGGHQQHGDYQQGGEVERLAGTEEGLGHTS
jgi:hypothetical protein